MTQIPVPADAAAVIRQCALFRGLTPTSNAAVAAMAVTREFAAGQTIFRQGEPCPGVYIVAKGLVRISRLGEGGAQHVLHLCQPSHSFAEVAVFAGFDLPANATAVEPTRCVLIPAEPFRSLLDDDHDVCRQMLAGMAYWTRHFTSLLEDLVLRDAQNRVASYLSSLPVDEHGWVQLPGTKKDIANHLNLTGETFSRIVRRLTDQGQIQVDPGRRIRLIGLPIGD